MGSAAAAGWTNTSGQAGYSQLNGLYKQYRVLGGKAKINVAPANNQDIMYFTAGFTSLVSAYTSVQPVAGFVGNEDVKTIQASNGNEASNHMTLPFATAEVLGLSKTQFEALPVTQIGTDPVSGAQVVLFLQWQQADSTILINNCPVSVELTQRIELTGKQWLS